MNFEKKSLIKSSWNVSRIMANFLVKPKKRILLRTETRK